jgi:methylmalonyl-CoA mutase N-terminal domain/subunit
VEREQVRELGVRRGGRDDARVRASLDAMLAAARDGSNMIGPMLDATRAEATLGEICGVLRDEWGVYTEPAGF